MDRFRNRWQLNLSILCVLVLSGAECPPTTDPNGDTSSDKVMLTLHGLIGTETSMKAVVWVGARGVSRAEAADPAALQAAGFRNSTVESQGEPGDLMYQIEAATGEIVTVIAVESEGIFNPVQFTDAPDPLNNVVEFRNFSGTSVPTPATGLAVFAVSDDEIDLIANYRRMPQIVLFGWGAFSVHFDFDIPPVLTIPQADNTYNDSFDSGSVIFAPGKFVHRTMQFKTGTTVSVTISANGEFLGWDGTCSGSAEECTLTFGVNEEDQVTTAVCGYRECTIGSSTTYSGYDPGSPPGAGCMIVEP